MATKTIKHPNRFKFEALMRLTCGFRALIMSNNCGVKSNFYLCNQSLFQFLYSNVHFMFYDKRLKFYFDSFCKKLRLIKEVRQINNRLSNGCYLSRGVQNGVLSPLITKSRWDGPHTTTP